MHLYKTRTTKVKISAHFLYNRKYFFSRDNFFQTKGENYIRVAKNVYRFRLALISPLRSSLRPLIAVNVRGVAVEKNGMVIKWPPLPSLPLTAYR